VVRTPANTLPPVPGAVPVPPLPSASPVRVVKQPARPSAEEQARARASAEAKRLITEARGLQRARKLVEARARVLEAQKLRVPFTSGEDNPSLVYQQLALDATREVDRLVARANQHMSQGSGSNSDPYRQAEKDLRAAQSLARTFGQDTYRVDDKLAQLNRLVAKAKQPAVKPAVPSELPPLPASVTPSAPSPTPVVVKHSEPKPPAVPGSGIPPAPQPAPVVVKHSEPKPPAVPGSGIPPAPQPAPVVVKHSEPKPPAVPGSSTPRAPQPAPVVVKNKQPVAPPPTPPRTARTRPRMTQGEKLLAQARLELQKSEVNTARRLAVEASRKQYGVTQQAIALLRTIDAEEIRQKALQASRTFDAAHRAYLRQDYHNARNLLAAVPMDLLDAGRKAKMKEIANTPEMQPEEAVARKGETGSPDQVDSGSLPEGDTTLVGHQAEGAEDSIGRARAEDRGITTPQDALLRSMQARRSVLFQKLHRDGLEVQKQAREKFRTGQTDEALDLLQNYLAQLGEHQFTGTQMALLRRPIEARLSRYRLLKAQQDLRTQRTQTVQAQKDAISRKALAEQQKNENVAALMKKYNALYKQGKYGEARVVALQAHELDPDNPLISTAIHMSKMQQRRTNYDKIKSDREEIVLEALNNAEKQGPASVIEDNLTFDTKRWEVASRRKDLTAISSFRKLEKEREIESRLTRPVSLSFTDAPLETVINDLQTLTGINFFVDKPALRDQAITLEQPVTIKIDDPISLKSALNLLLHNVGLTYVIENEVIKITTEAHAQGKLGLVAYQVADLVIPIQNFGDLHSTTAPPILGVNTSGTQGSPLPGGATPLDPRTLPPGAPTGSPSGSQLDANSPFATQPGYSPGGVSVQKRGPAGTMEDTLIKLITSTVAPRSWSNMGGPGTVDYFPHTMSLVINQTADIQEQVQDLLAALRRLQDQEVAVEVRFITINENFFERIGVKFSANIVTDDITDKFEPQITSGNFKPAGFINQFSPDRFLAGITPAGTFTPTLDIPINVQTFEQALPPFGGYPGVPGFGGLTLGLGFLSDIQVFLFMEAVQGDTRTNVMQAPKLTLFNGQTASLFVTDQQIFVTGVTVTAQSGQFVYVPQVQTFPIGVNLQIQAVISADRRFVRMSLTPTLTNLATPMVQLFPIVTPIFPLIDGTSTGQPIVFTQFIQQPVITQVGVQTTVAVPDGGTVLLGGLKRLSEGRNEYGPPILSKLPYVNRLFKNVGYGRETDSLLMMVTPRIIIQEEEEERQTGVTRPPSVNF
jgi:type II secretory pathway component GspD/PulD (secretin)